MTVHLVNLLFMPIPWLAQLLCMKYLDKIYFGEPCNYEMAFYEYTKQMKNSSMQKFDRQIAMKAMEHLEVTHEWRWIF